MRCVLCASLLLFGSLARADFISQVRSVPSTMTDWTRSLSFDAFDPAKGTLDEVRLDAVATIDHQFFSTPGVVLTAGPSVVTVGPYLTLTESVVVRSDSDPPPAHAFLMASAFLPLDVGPLVLPVSASSASSFSSDSGNGSGTVLTDAALDVTLTYGFTPNNTPVGSPFPTVPTPSSVISWITGMLIITLCRNGIRKIC